MRRQGTGCEGRAIGTFMVTHRHKPNECRFAFAAWKGFESPLRHNSAIGSCAEGGHSLWWTVEAEDEQAALHQLPPYLAERSEVTRVSELAIP